MNQDQTLSIVRTIMGSVSVWAMGKGYGDSNLWTFLGGVAALAVPFVWGIYVHTDSSKLAAVEAMPDVKSIVPVTGASGAVAAAVADPNRPKVIDADPAPPSSPSKPASA